ncbi:MAG: hypothetical protein JSV53_04565 [candidate division WOR-3 bacterium]|nr:MAG: hypothetical protein JSV53_04565 [candidate division WOR-3 bacterium]
MKGKRMKINWKRLAWVVFVILYAGLFFFNCLKPFNNWFAPYVFTIILVVWLAYEYYNKNLFFQSGLIPDSLYFWLSRALFALFFYSSFVIGIATVIWWPKNQMGLYPFVNILGIAVLVVSIYLRQITFHKKPNDREKVKYFYLSLCLLNISIALGYGSLFLLGYAVVIGLPLTYWNYWHEGKVLSDFADYIKKQGVASTKGINYTKYWGKYLASREKKPKQK